MLHEPNAYLLRPVPHGIDRLELFRMMGMVAVGWPGMGSLETYTREGLKVLLSGAPYHLTSLALGNAYATLDIFVNQIKVGDLLLVPSGNDIFFAQVTSDYIFDPTVDNMTDGYSHQRKVTWLAHVGRNQLSKELRSSLKVQRATAVLTKHIKEISALAHGRPYPPAAPVPAAAPAALARILEGDGSANEQAGEILSRCGDAYEQLLHHATAMADIFHSIGGPPLATEWNSLTDIMFQLAAFHAIRNGTR